MKKLTIYANGQQIYSEGAAGMVIHGVAVAKEIDVTDATDTEIVSLKANPHNNALIALIKNRRTQGQ